MIITNVELEQWCKKNGYYIGVFWFPNRLKTKQMRKELGKIESIKFGHGGYQDAQIGLSVTLSGKSWGVGDFKGAWDPEIITISEFTKWTEEDRDKGITESVRFLSKLLQEAKVHSVDELKGIPVEVYFDENQLKEWRILTEVL